jgi:hypothetical protein
MNYYIIANTTGCLLSKHNIHLHIISTGIYVYVWKCTAVAVVCFHAIVLRFGEDLTFAFDDIK